MKLSFAAAAFAALLLALPRPAAAQFQKDVLTIDDPGEAATLDPQVQWDPDSFAVYRNIFDNLVTRDKSGKILPQIATAWRYIDDNTLEFDIRDGVKFTDGSPLTAEDVVFSIRRITDPKFNSPALGQFDSIIDAQLAGPGKVRVKTKTPYAPLLAQLVKLSIVPEAYVKKVGDQQFNLHPIGSGPYKLREWQKGVAVTVDANESYWRGKPPFKTVIYRAVPDVSTRIADLKSGRADLMRLLPPDQAIQLSKDKNVQVLAVPSESVSYMFINAMYGPTKDVRVRQAIAYAVDKQSIIDLLQQGYAKPVNVIGTPPVFGYPQNVKGYDYDPDKARALIKAAGAEGAVITFNTSPAYDQHLVGALQQMINDVGLKVNVVTYDQPTFLRHRQGDPSEAGSMTIGVWSCACEDADGVIYPLFRSGSSWSKYSNPAFDAAVDAARNTVDPKARLADYAKAYEIMRQDVPGIGLYQMYATYAASPHLKWQPSADQAFFIMDMGWTP